MDGRQGRPMITYGTPLKEASSDTLSRWIKGELSNAEIGADISKFKVVEQLQQAKLDSRE